VEDTCDKVAFIKDGKIISSISTEEIKHNQDKTFKLEFETNGDYTRFLAESLEFSEQREAQNQVLVNIHDTQINAFIRLMSGYRVKFITEIKYSLEKYFKTLY